MDSDGVQSGVEKDHSSISFQGEGNEIKGTADYEEDFHRQQDSEDSLMTADDIAREIGILRFSKALDGGFPRIVVRHNLRFDAFSESESFFTLFARSFHHCMLRAFLRDDPLRVPMLQAKRGYSQREDHRLEGA